MPEFHQLPSHTTESERYLRKMKNDESSSSYDTVEQWMIQQWDEWNEQALQRTLQNSKTPAKMPSLNHLTYRDFQNVYEPSDDTYLLLDAIQYELLLSSSSFEESPQSSRCSEASNDNVENNSDDHDSDTPKICLEIGSGSGVVSVYFRSCWLQQQQQEQQHHEEEEATECLERSNQKRRRRPFLISYVTDINPLALQTTYRTFQEAARNQTNRRPDEEELPTSQYYHHHAIETPSRIDHVEYVLCDIATPLLSRLRHQVSTIICNPPYVPTCDDDNDNDDNKGATPDLISAAYAGGPNGRRVVDRIVAQIIQLLHVPDGVAYLVTVDDNLPLDLSMSIYRQQKQQQPAISTNRILLMKPLFRKRTKNEFLTIQKITYVDPGCCATWLFSIIEYLDYTIKENVCYHI